MSRWRPIDPEAPCPRRGAVALDRGSPPGQFQRRRSFVGSALFQLVLAVGAASGARAECFVTEEGPKSVVVREHKSGFIGQADWDVFLLSGPLGDPARVILETPAVRSNPFPLLTAGATLEPPQPGAREIRIRWFADAFAGVRYTLRIDGCAP